MQHRLVLEKEKCNSLNITVYSQHHCQTVTIEIQGLSLGPDKLDCLVIWGKVCISSDNVHTSDCVQHTNSTSSFAGQTLIPKK